MFGLIASVIVPICDVSDESEHIARAEITSNGVLFPYRTGEDYNLTRTYNYTPNDVKKGLNKNAGYEVPHATTFLWATVKKRFSRLIMTPIKLIIAIPMVYSAFEQNQFFGYIPHALGVAIAKLLDLNLIRFCGLEECLTYYVTHH